MSVIDLRALNEWFERGHRFAELVSRLGWPPPVHMPIPFGDAIVVANTKGPVSDAEVEALFVGYYDNDRIVEVLKAWEGYAPLRHRIPVIREAIDCHITGRYYAAVCTLLPQIEGALGDVLGRRPNPKRDSRRVFANDQLSVVAMEFYERLATESFSWSPSNQVPDLSRHAVLHGRAVSYGTRTHSLKIVLTMDALLTGLYADGANASPNKHAR